MIKEQDLETYLHRRSWARRTGSGGNTYLGGPIARSIRTSPDERGIKRLFKQFSFPGGIPSHAAPETPGSIHEGGELGYASRMLTAPHRQSRPARSLPYRRCEGRDGPLAGSWHANKFLNPVHDGAVAADFALERVQNCQSHCPPLDQSQELEELSRLWLQANFVEGDEPFCHGPGAGKCR